MDRLWAPWRMEYLMSDGPHGCIFCDKPAEDDDRKNLILLRTPLSLSELTPEERCDVMDTVAAGERILERAFSPQGMNIGINLGHCAGAGVPGHVHVHIVPRWEGDTNFMPVLGETRVIPELLIETYDRLKQHLEEG